MNKHTPGPWTTQTYTPGFDQDGDPFEDQIRVITRTCEVASGIQCEADARLIAAAPELLGALQAILEEAGPQYGNDDGPGCVNRMARIARAAIAKAT